MKKFIFAVLALAFSLSIFASNLKIGVIDIRAIMMQSPQVVSAQNKLKARFASEQNKIIQQQKLVKSDIAQYKKNNSVMTKKDRANARQKIMNSQNKLRTMQISFQKKAVSAQREVMSKVIKNISSAVKGVAKSGNYTIVLSKASVAYNSKDMDITSKVISALKKN